MEADAASREFNIHTEWMLRQDVFWGIAHHVYVPEIEVLASCLNHQLPLCVATNRPQCFSSGRLLTGLEPPTSGATTSKLEATKEPRN